MKKGKLSIFAVCFLSAVVLIFNGALNSGTAYADAAPQKIFVALGDSIAAGSGASSAAQRYVNIVTTQLNLELRNDAVGGHQTSHLLDIVQNNESKRADIAAADYINISIGGNDLQGAPNAFLTEIIQDAMLGDYEQMDVLISQIYERFVAIIETIKELNSTATIFMFYNYTPDYTRYASTDMGTLTHNTAFNGVTGSELYAIGLVCMEKLNAVYDEYLAEHAGAYMLVDATVMNGVSSNFAADLIHPSNQGHALLAKTLKNSISIFELASSLAYSAGSDEGYSTGYASGNIDGYSAGSTDGYDTGYIDGNDEGFENGYESGFSAGNTAGYTTGYQAGHETGYAAGVIQGTNDAAANSNDTEGLPAWAIVLIVMGSLAVLGGGTVFIINVARKN